MAMILIAPFRVTKAQREWLNNESERTGEPVSAVLRGLIQVKIDNVKRVKK